MSHIRLSTLISLVCRREDDHHMGRVNLRRLKAKHRRRLGEIASLPEFGSRLALEGNRTTLTRAGVCAGAVLTAVLFAVVGPPLVSGARTGLVPGLPSVTVSRDITKRILAEGIPALALKEGGPEDTPAVQVSGLPKGRGLTGQAIAVLTGLSDYDPASIIDAALPLVALIPGEPPTAPAAAPSPMDASSVIPATSTAGASTTSRLSSDGQAAATRTEGQAGPGAPERPAPATQVLRPQPGQDARATASAGRLSSSWGDSPLIAILHSHSSEAYRATSGADYLWGGDGGVIAVGDELASTLVGEFGVPVIHSRKVHDLPKWREAYVRAAGTIEEMLSAFPSIEMVLDIHRDAAPGPMDAGQTLQVNGQKSAKVLVVVSNDKFGLPHPRWTENLAFARQLDAKMTEMYPGLSRGVAVRSTGRFNQHLHHRAVILEIGATVNTLAEAKTAARLLARVLASLLRDIEGG